MELEAELDRLFGLPLEEFIAARNALAKRLRQAGDRPAGDRVKALAKPSLTAWAVNQLHFRAPDELAALIAAGEALRAAHLAGAEVHRAAMTARREAISTLLALAGEIFEADGRQLSRSHRQRIFRTLEALASQGVEPGRLSRDLEPAGFDALSDLAAALGTVPRLRLVTAEEGPPPAGDRAEEVAAEEPAAGVAGTIDFTAERQRRREKVRRERQRELEGVDRQLAAARQTAEGIAAQVAELERRAVEAGGERSAAEGSAAAAAAAADEAERRAREAREAAVRARREAESTAAAAKRAADDLAAARVEVARLEEERRRLGDE